MVNIENHHDVSAEQALLGGIIMSNDNYYTSSDIINKDMFYIGAHGMIYETIEQLINKNMSADPVSITSALGSSEWFKELGGEEFLRHLNDNSSKIIRVKTYCNIILEKYKMRLFIEHATNGINGILKDDREFDVDTIINNATTALMDLTDTSTSDKGFKSLDCVSSVYEKALAAMKSGDPITGLKTNFNRFDDLTGGLKGGKLFVLAARPAMGKSALAFNMAQNVAQNYLKEDHGGKVAIFSLEMGRDEIKTRLVSSFSGIDQDKIEKGRLSNADIEKIQYAEREVNTLPIAIDETGGLHINQIKARSIKMKKKHGLDLIVIDYLQLCKGNNPTNKNIEVGEITGGLKALAKDLNVPVVVLSQLNRNLGSRDNKRPIMSDLRDSGSIEQDADMIMFLHREQYYHDKNISLDKESNDYKKSIKAIIETFGITELIVAKNRAGVTENIKMLFDSSSTSFIDFNISGFSIGLEDKVAGAINSMISSEFGDEWYNNQIFLHNVKSFIEWFKTANINEVKTILDLEIERTPNLKGASPIIIGALAYHDNLIK